MDDIFDIIVNNESKSENNPITPSKYTQAVFDWIKSGDGGATINAVAGSGKTTTIVDSSKITSGTALFCAFNKHIEEELSCRLGRSVICKTIHSIGYDAMRTSCGKIKLDNDKYSSICNKVMPSIMQKISDNGLNHSRKNVFKMLKKSVNMVRNTMCETDDFSKFDKICSLYSLGIDNATRKIIFEYISKIIKEGNKLSSEGCIDFTDMIYYPVVKDLPMREYSWVMVDEVQDLSSSQLSIVKKSLKKNGRLIAVGDPNQSIYGFTGADPWSFKRVGEIAQNSLPLSICYRCPTSVIEMASKIVPSIEPRANAPKGIFLQVESISKMLKPKDMVICRKNAPLIVECLKAISIGKKAFIRGVDFKESLIEIIDSTANFNGYNFKNFEIDLRISQMREMKRLISEGEEESADRIGDVYDALIGIYISKKPDNVFVLKEIINSVFEESNDSIIFSSIHKSKGLEADRVFIIDANKVRLKWKDQKPWQEFQEQCCEYVALTRPKSELYVVTSDSSDYKVGKTVSL